MSKEVIPLKTELDEDGNYITYRQEPTTSVQKFDLWMQDLKTVIKKYWWLWLSLIVIPIFIAFLWYVSTTESIKEAIGSTLKAIGVFLFNLINLFFSNIGAGLVAFIVAYMLAKKLIHREKILFEEFNGEQMFMLGMRKTEDEVILYKERKNFFATLLKGKIKIHIDYETFDLLETVGEKKLLNVEHEELEVFRVYILPQAHMEGEELFIENEKGKMSLNTNYLIDKNDIEEYVLKSQLAGVDPVKLRNTLVNLTKKHNAMRQRVAMMENEFEDLLENKFWNYLSYQTPKNSAGRQIIREAWKATQAKRTIPPEEEEELAREYLKQIEESYTEQEEVVENYE